jgi:hypothetical protein
MLEHKLLYKFQSGFVSGHSTSHQLIELYHQICIALENGQITVAVPFMPYDFNFSIKPLCQRRSNALEISQKTATVI